MKLHEQRQDIYNVQYTYVPAQIPALVSTLETWLVTQTPSETCIFMMTLGPDGNRT